MENTIIDKKIHSLESNWQKDQKFLVSLYRLSGTIVSFFFFFSDKISTKYFIYSNKKNFFSSYSK